VLYLWRPSYVDALASRSQFDAVVYHIDDEYTFTETTSAITADELELIREADAVIIHSPGLAERKGSINDSTYIVPNGVDYDRFTRRREQPQDLSAIPHPRIGYTGVIKKQLDISLVRRLVERCSTWSFVLVGPLGNLSGVEAEFEALSRAPNVHVLGYRDAGDLPAYQQHLDVCIMPYRLNYYTDCIYPLKLHEYLASGKPIVASPIRTLRDFSNVVSLASEVEEWVAAIKSSLTEEAHSDERVSFRRAIAAQHDWSILAAKTAGIMASALGGDVSKRVLDAQVFYGKAVSGEAADSLLMTSRRTRPLPQMGRETDKRNKAPVKSLLISSAYFPPQIGGISRMMEEICIALGPSWVSCFTGVPQTQAISPRLASIRIHRRPSAFTGNQLMRNLSLACALSEIVARDRPRVVQLSTCNEGYLGLQLQRWFKLPFIVYAHGNEILAAIDSVWDKPRLALKKAACVLANSNYTAGLLQRAGVAPEAITILPLGCDIDRFRPRTPNLQLRRKVLGDRAQGPVILTVGGLVERKGQDMVIRSLPAVCQRVPDATYLIVGAGPFKERLDKLAAELGVRDRVIFAGSVPDEELPDFYAMCDVFAMPSRARLASHDVEGFGLVFLEANACAKPVVAGRSGGIEDAVVDGFTGLVVDPSDVRDVSQALIRLLTDSELRGRLGQQGRNRVEKQHTWSFLGARVGDILERAGNTR
jgi:phosphatidylinositol alpha-1,6-mannosyltransferase